MDTSPMEGSESIVSGATDKFCKAFADERAFRGPLARAIAHGSVPQGVDPYDPRVLAIRRKCREQDERL